MMQGEWEERVDELEELRTIANLARVTREAQMQYFATRKKEWLKESIRLERRLDDALSVYFGVPLTLDQAQAMMTTDLDVDTDGKK